jgi:hypothetical protein
MFPDEPEQLKLIPNPDNLEVVNSSEVMLQEIQHMPEPDIFKVIDSSDAEPVKYQSIF